MRKYSRNINYQFELVSFESKEVEKYGYKTSYIIQVTSYMIIGSLFPSENTPPAYAQIYLYDTANDD